MTLAERTISARQLWTLVLPDVELPTDRQFALWANRFSDTQLERAFLRVGRKFPHGGIETDSLHRYVTGLLLNQEREAAGRTEQHHDQQLGWRNQQHQQHLST
jgi:hypothetical protein